MTALALASMAPGARGAPVGSPARILDGPRGTVYSISLSSDASLVAAVSDVTSLASPERPSRVLGAQLRVWDARTGEIRLALGFEAPVKAAALSPDGRTLAAGTTSGVVLHDAETGARARALPGDLKSIDALLFSRDGRLLVAQSSERGKGELRVRTADGRTLAVVSDPEAPFHGLSLSGDGRTLAAASGKAILLWDAETGVLKKTLREEEDEVRSLALSARGDAVAVPVVFRLKLLDAKTGALARTIPEFLTEVAYSGDGRRLAGLLNESVAVLDARTWATKKVIELGSLASSFALSADGRWLATGHALSGRGEVRLWDLSKAPDRPVKKEEAAGGPKLPVIQAFTCDDTQVTKDTALWDVEGGGGDKLLLRPTPEPCRHALVYRGVSGKETIISRSPGMNVAVAAKRFKRPQGDAAVVCVSAIAHSRLDANPGHAPRALNRRIDAAPIDCAVEVAGNWGRTATVVSGGSSWAAWVIGLTEMPGKADRLKLRFVRDSTFQFMSPGGPDRGLADGVYEAELKIGAGKPPKAGPAVKVADRVAPR